MGSKFYHEYTCQTDVQIGVPIEHVENSDTLGELLLGFFTFYLFEFNNQEQVISAKAPYLTKEEYKQQLRTRIDNGEVHPSCLEFVLERLDDWAYMIEDPFDCTYNPGRQVHVGSDIHIRYERQMKKSIDVLI